MAQNKICYVTINLLYPLFVAIQYMGDYKQDTPFSIFFTSTCKSSVDCRQ